MNRSIAALFHRKLRSRANIALALVLLLSCRPGVHAQGLINFLNSSQTLIALSTNGVNNGPTPPTLGAFRFELFIAPAGTLNPASFTATGLIATNLASAGRLSGGNNLAVPGVALGGTAAILVRGWSANLGTNYAQAIAASLTTANGYIGESSIAPNFLFGGDGGAGNVPTSPAFGGSSGIQAGFDLHLSCLSCGYFPRFEVNPSSQSVAAGSDVALHAFAKSDADCCYPMSYAWRKNGVFITGASTPSLTIHNVQTTDAGNYDVMAYNSYGFTYSSVATLTVFVPALAATLGSPTYTTDHQFQFTVTGTAGSNYVVQVSTNLSATTNWISLFTNTAPFTFVDSNADGFPRRFYRAYAP
jgi:hypothetical protein